MNTLIKTTISVLVLTVGSTSIALAGKHDRQRGEDGSRQEQSSRDYEVRGEKKHFRNNKSELRHSYLRGDRKHHGSRHNGKHHRKHVYRDRHHANRYPGRRKVVKHVVHHDNYRPYGHNGHHLSALMGGLIGSAIGHDLGRGDPAATATGAVFGTIMGRALLH